jgi:hypothetical protein
MFTRTYRSLLIGVAVALLAGCGGDGPSTISYRPPTPTPTPTPTPAPAPTPAIISGATATQAFEVKGATYNQLSFPNYDGPLIAGSDQLQVRYDASSNTYEIRQVGQDGWDALSPAGTDWTTKVAGLGTDVAVQMVADPDRQYTYSALARWHEPYGVSARLSGGIAFGAPSDPSAVPLSGSATFDGIIAGFTTETWDWADWGRGLGTVDGTIQLRFDFGAGSLAGSISPRVYANAAHDLPPMDFVETVFSKGSTAFSGKFDTSLTGANAFSGMFTGPQANELIGNFVFPYRSADDGKNYEAGGGFIARH